MLAPGLANLCWCSISCSLVCGPFQYILVAGKLVLAQHLVLGGLRTLSVHFGSLLKKLLFLGRTLLLRLWVLGTHVRKRLGRLLQSVGGWKRLGRLGKHVRRLGRLGRQVRRRLGSLARRRLLDWLVGWLVGWLDGWLIGKLVSW